MNVTFGSLAAGANDTSLKLLENVNYIRSFLTGECAGGGDPRSGGGGYPVGGPNPPEYPSAPPAITRPVCDAMQKSAVAELVLVPDGQEWTLETNLVVDYQGSPDRAERFHADGSYTDLYLVSTSRRTALVVRDGMDAMTVGEEGLEVDSTLEEEPTFGVAYRVLHGAGGQPTYFARLSPDHTTHPDERDPDGADPTYDQKCQPQRRHPGTSDDPAPEPEPITSYPVPTISEQVQTIQASGDEANLDGDENCACNGEDVSQAHNAVAGTDTSTGNQHDYNSGDQYDPFPGTAAGGPSAANGYGLARRSGIMLNDGPRIPVGNAPGSGRAIEYDPSTGKIVVESGNNNDQQNAQDMTGMPADKVCGLELTNRQPRRRAGSSASGSGGSYDKNRRIAELTALLSLDALGLGTGAAMVVAPEPLSSALGALMVVGALMTTVAHVDELISVISDAPCLMSDEVRDVLELVGSVLQLVAGVAQLLKYILPKAVQSIDDLAGSIARILKGGGGDALEGANFAQRTFSSAFSSGGKFAGQTVDDVAAALRSGKLSPADVPIEYIVRDGQTLILNTRSAMALQRAGISRSQWNAVNMTGDAAAEARLTTQLQNNGLGSQGTSTVTQSGG